MLTADALRDVLLTPEEAAAMDVHGRTDAAVLVALYGHGAGRPGVVFTKRREDLRRHAGEISFPGGRQDHPDEDLRRTALREAEEEIGLDPGSVEIVGALPPMSTFVTNYRVHPFVGLIPDGVRWRLQAAEVERVLEVGIDDLLAGYAMRRLIRRGVPIRTDTFLVGDDLIWGATGRILKGLLDRLAPLL